MTKYRRVKWCDVKGCVSIKSDVVNAFSKQYERAVSLTSSVIESFIGGSNNEIKMRAIKLIQDTVKV